MNDNDKNQEGTPSPYQNAETEVETTYIFYFSPAKQESIFLGKTRKRVNGKGEVSYDLIDPAEKIFGAPVDDKKSVQETWATIAITMEKRAEELQKKREKDNKGQDKGIER